MHNSCFNIHRLQKVKTILKCRIHHLNTLIPSLSVTATPSDMSSLHFSIATCHKRLVSSCDESERVHAHLSSALKHCQTAMDLDSENREDSLWLSKLLERQRDVEMIKQKAADKLSAVMDTERRGVLKMPEPVQV